MNMKLQSVGGTMKFDNIIVRRQIIYFLPLVKKSAIKVEKSKVLLIGPGYILYNN